MTASPIAQLWREQHAAAKARTDLWDISRLAHETAYTFSGARPPVDVDRIADKLGVRVDTIMTTEWYAAVQSSEREAVVWLRSEVARPWQRYALAHALGHLILHDTAKAICDVEFGQGGREGEANLFAHALLVPALMLDEASRSMKPPAVAQLAVLFDVPEKVMTLAAANLLDRTVRW